MGSKKKTTTTQDTTATTTPAAWATSGAEQNYADAQKYYGSGDATWSADKAAQYANPYQTLVQDRTVARMNTQNQVDHAALNDTVQAAKAYGGTRGAILESEQAKNQSNGILDFLASSNAQGYNEARSAFEADRAAKMGQYSSLAGILATSPKTTTTTGKSNGTQVQQGSALDTVLGLGQLGLSAYSTFSDRRLKKHVTLIDRAATGLGRYSFRYLWERASSALHIGVMADEVAELRPDALGPVVAGYRTVDYSKLQGAF